MPTLAEVEEPSMEALTAQDRCDRCGAQAYVRVIMPGAGSGVLLFCAHHARDHRDAIVAKGGVIAVDETHKLTAPRVVELDTCRHCHRGIVLENGRWIDPEAPATPADGDDHMWRETCDRHDTRTAEHEPSD